MRLLLARTDELLRGGAWATRTVATTEAARYLITLLVGFAFLYGAAMGTYGGFWDFRLWQVFYSAVKVPLLLLCAFGLSLPSYFVINTLFGLRDDFAESLRALMAGQAVLAIVLCSLAPLTLFWYASSPPTKEAYEAAVMFNGLMFGIASLSAQWLLRRYYQPLVARNRRHRWALRSWLVLYVFVAIQIAWVLRPFVGDPRLEVQFFRQEAWGNAYVHIAQTLWRLISR